MHMYQLPRPKSVIPASDTQINEITAVREKWAQLEPCQFGCGGKIVRSGECSNHCPPSRGMQREASESFADLSGFSEAYPILQRLPAMLKQSRDYVRLLRSA